MLGKGRALALGLISVCASTEGAARAEDTAPVAAATRPAGDAAIEIRGSGNGLPVELYDDRGESSPAPIVRCTTPCQSRIPPGRYHLVIRETGRTVLGNAVIGVARDTRVWVDPYTKTDRAFSLVLAFTGSVLLIAGGVMFGTDDTQGESCETSSGDHCTGGSDRRTVGLGLMLAGVAGSIGGWGWYASTFSPGVIVQASSADRSATRQPPGSRSSALGPQGATVGLRFAF